MSQRRKVISNQSVKVETVNWGNRSRPGSVTIVTVQELTMTPNLLVSLGADEDKLHPSFVSVSFMLEGETESRSLSLLVLRKYRLASVNDHSSSGIQKMINSAIFELRQSLPPATDVSKLLSIISQNLPHSFHSVFLCLNPAPEHLQETLFTLSNCPVLSAESHLRVKSILEKRETHQNTLNHQKPQINSFTLNIKKTLESKKQPNEPKFDPSKLGFSNRQTMTRSYLHNEVPSLKKIDYPFLEPPKPHVYSQLTSPRPTERARGSNFLTNSSKLAASLARSLSRETDKNGKK